MSFDETAREVGSTVDRRIRRLQSLSEHPRRAVLANLRRGVGRAPGELPELWGSFLADMPEEFFGRGGAPSEAEWAVYLALTLYALHQQGQTRPMCVQEEGLGRAVRRLSADPEDGVYRRFCALVTAGGMEEISHHLRGLIQLLRDKSLPLDYPQLARDLYRLQFPQSAPGVKLQWGQEYFSRKDADGQQEDSDDRQEKEDTDE